MQVCCYVANPIFPTQSFVVTSASDTDHKSIQRHVTANPRPVHVRFVVDSVPPAQAFLRVLQSFLVRIFPSMPDIHPFVHSSVTDIIYISN